MHQKLFHRDFSIMIIGQIISLFGNSILRFSLSLYVLDLTGSAAVFGGILALSMIPTILFSPIGGIIADRVNRRNIMVALDYSTAALITVFAIFFSMGDSLLLIGAVMILLSLIQSFYQPSVQASIPALTNDENLMKANGVVIQVNALANLVGPILGGFLYGFLGIEPIIIASGVCFFLSATMELFLHIPFIRQERKGDLIADAVGDLKSAFFFLSKDNPKMFQLLFAVAGINLFLSAMIMVGLPYIIRIFLGLSSQHNGFAEGALAVGSILGGCLAGIVGKKIQMSRSYVFLFAGSIVLLPIAISLISNASPFLSYGVVLVCVMLCMCMAALFSIFAQTYMQQKTPPVLLGKVASFVTVISMCALPLGQAMYGGLFDWLKNNVYLVVLFAGVASVVISFAVRKALINIDA